MNIDRDTSTIIFDNTGFLIRWDEWVICVQWPARASSMELSTISLIQWSRPRASVNRYTYLDALWTASRPSRTWSNWHHIVLHLLIVFLTPAKMAGGWSKGYRYSQFLVCRGLWWCGWQYKNNYLGWFSHLQRAYHPRGYQVFVHSWQFLAMVLYHQVLA